MDVFRQWEEQEEERWDPGLVLRSMAVVQSRQLLDPERHYNKVQYKVAWADQLDKAWRCQETAPHRYTILLHKGHLLAFVCMQTTLTVGGVPASTFNEAVLLMVLQAMALILVNREGADKDTLLARSGLRSLRTTLSSPPSEE